MMRRREWPAKLRHQLGDGLLVDVSTWIGRSAERALAVERLLLAFMATKPEHDRKARR